jgi:hypothetical protein
VLKIALSAWILSLGIVNDLEEKAAEPTKRMIVDISLVKLTPGDMKASTTPALPSCKASRR